MNPHLRDFILVLTSLYSIAPGRINLVQQVVLSDLHAAPVLRRELRCNHEPPYQFSFTCRGNDLDWATENSLANPTREN